MPCVTDLKQSLGRIDSLPAMPIIAQKMLALPLDTDEGEIQLLKLIAQDPQISAKIIGLSNTALFGAPGAITSVSDASMRLGLTLVKSVAISMATMSTLKKSSEGTLKSADLWAHSMAIALTMRIIAKQMPARMRPMEDQIFLAGLLHDIGYNALSYLDTDTSNALHEKLNLDPDAPLLEIEQELLDTHHGEIGAQLATHWGLPEEIVAVIRYHHTPENPGAEIGQPLVNLVNIAEKLLVDYGITERTAQEMTDEAWTSLNIDTSKVDAIAEEINTVAEKVNQIASA